MFLLIHISAWHPFRYKHFSYYSTYFYLKSFCYLLFLLIGLRLFSLFLSFVFFSLFAMHSVSSKLFSLASKMNANLSVSYLLSIILHAMNSITYSFFPSIWARSFCRYRFSFTSFVVVDACVKFRKKKKETHGEKYIQARVKSRLYFFTAFTIIIILDCV